MASANSKSNIPSPPQALEYSLTQAEYGALINCAKTVIKFGSVDTIFKDSTLFAAVAGGKGMVHANYAPLIKHPVTMAFNLDKATIKQMALIKGAGDVRVSLQEGKYHIQGDHTGTFFPAIPMPDAAYFTLPSITWLGVEVSGYDTKNLNSYIGKIGKKGKAVHLAVYGDQLEQIGVEGAGGPYTFTAGMSKRLAGRRPNLVLQSQVAFRFIGPKQSLRIGKMNDQYVLRATNNIDMKVDVVVTERLDVVSSR